MEMKLVYAGWGATWGGLGLPFGRGELHLMFRVNKKSDIRTIKIKSASLFDYKTGTAIHGHIVTKWTYVPARFLTFA